MRRLTASLLAAAIAVGLHVGATQAQSPATPTTIVERQPYRQETSVVLDGRGSATLIDLNPNVGASLLLTLDSGDATGTHHLDNPNPADQRVSLSSDGLVIEQAGERRVCAPWSGTPSALAQAHASGLPYAPLCAGDLYLRNPVAGRRSNLEQATDFLRDHVWGGEAIVGFVRDQFFRDAHREEAKSTAAPAPPSSTDGPRAAALGPEYTDQAVVPEHLGIAVEGPTRLVLGRWYPSAHAADVYVGVMQPGAVDPTILASHPDRVSRLDAVEAAALDYLVAFDLEAFEIGFALGTDHPRLDWSPRALAEVRIDALPGPDGIGTRDPLVTSGIVSPAAVARTVATFTGGFKRSHSAFKYGDLALVNRGSHYGFIEAGVVFSTLQPSLATVYRLAGGALEMKTWTKADDPLLPRLDFARQNGVPLVVADPLTGRPVPGELVNRWGPGNWSGSAQGELRALRAGACLQNAADRRYLIYAYFSTATPSAMARVFQAYHCRYAMLLDMNALEHTYMALYHQQDDRIVVEHLVRGMEVLDESLDGEIAPRFLAFPDNRDFFYVLRREDRP